MTNFKTKNGDYSKTSIQFVSRFFSEYNSDSFVNRWRLLSHFYSSRSTKYHSILNSGLFQISTEQAIITGAGFSKLAKRVIRLNLNNPDTLSIMAVISEKSAKEKQAQAAYNAERDMLNAAIKAEANSLIIDDEFKAALNWGNEADGYEKSDRMASAMKGLLARNNKEKIITDFWKVFRILKAKVN